MKLSSLTVPALLLEMAAKKVCPVCGHGMVNYHFYYKGGFKCKSTSLAAPDVAAAKQSAADLIAAGYPATLDGLKAQTQGLAPGSTPTTAPTKPRATSTKVSSPTAPATPAKPAASYSGHQEKIANWLKANKITNFTINDDNSVDVDGDLVLDGLRFEKLPVNFKSVTGSVSLVGALLKTLEGLPDEINGDLNISALKLDSVDGFPMKVHGDCHLGAITVKSTLSSSRLAHVEGDLIINSYDAPTFAGLPGYVGGDFIVTDSKNLESLSGMPREIGGNCQFSIKKLRSLRGMAKKVGGDFDIAGSTAIDSIAGLGEVGGSIRIIVHGQKFSFSDLPRKINGSLTVQTAGAFPIESLDGFPDEVNGDINMALAYLKTPGKFNKHIKKMNGVLRIGPFAGGYNQDASKSYPLIGANLLSIPLIKGIKEVYIQPGGGAITGNQIRQITSMINRCIQGDIDIHELQEQLIDAGFTQYARL